MLKASIIGYFIWIVAFLSLYVPLIFSGVVAAMAEIIGFPLIISIAILYVSLFYLTYRVHVRTFYTWVVFGKFPYFTKVGSWREAKSAIGSVISGKFERIPAASEMSQSELEAVNDRRRGLLWSLPFHIFVIVIIQ